MGEKLTEVLANLLKWLSTAGVKIVIGFLALFSRLSMQFSARSTKGLKQKTLTLLYAKFS